VWPPVSVSPPPLPPSSSTPPKPYCATGSVPASPELGGAHTNGKHNKGDKSGKHSKGDKSDKSDKSDWPDRGRVCLDRADVVLRLQAIADEVEQFRRLVSML